jgi:hydroxymethylbilane synthase
MEPLRLTGRKSALSILQIEQVQGRIRELFPGIPTEIVPVDTRGDQLGDIPLQTVEGTDFFTTEVFEMLRSGRADIAVHSLKDMSAAHFFGGHRFAVTEREDKRDMVIFNPDLLEKIQAGRTLVIGTCSPRREDMAIEFLSTHLPSIQGRVSIAVKPIRGNVETRLRKLQGTEYDGTILATAGLNRMLRSESSGPMIRSLLASKKCMFLPLLECVPAPCQGAIVAEALPSNPLALQVLEALNDADLMRDCIQEKRMAQAFGVGCDQRFGVSVFTLGGKRYAYAGGRDGRGRQISYWDGLPETSKGAGKLFSSTDHMRSFYRYQYDPVAPAIQTEAVFVANYKAVTPEIVEQLRNKRVWVSGSKTWRELSARGIWVEGSADAMGFESLKSVFRLPVVSLNAAQITVLTHHEAAMRWREKGWLSISTYALQPAAPVELRQQLQKADFAFWTSFGQYRQCMDVLSPNIIHACPGGETAAMFRESGIEPIIFPTIQSFQSWRNSITA